MTDRIYLDHAATTPVDREVVEAMVPFFTVQGYNPSSLHAEGRAARAALDNARDRVARLLGADRKEITFVGSGSEADTQAILGVARSHASRGKHVVSSAIEHHAVLHSLDILRDEGFDVTLLQVDARGVVDPATFEAALRPDTVLATVMYANNELGTIQPIAELAAIARRHGVPFHTDAIQAAGWLDVNVQALGVDLLSISAHKFYGPKGVGVLYARAGVPVPALIAGGGQEFGRRSGTENVAGIVGLTAALERAAAGREEYAGATQRKRDDLEARIVSDIGNVRVNGAGAPRLPNILNVSFAGVDSETLLMRLDLEGIAVSAGSACTSGVLEPSHVVAALGIDPIWYEGVIRISLGKSTGVHEIERVLATLTSVVASLRRGPSAPQDRRIEGVI